MTEKSSPRRLAREIVLQALYASDCDATAPEAAFAEIAKEHTLSEKNLKFARTLFDLCLRHRDWADQQIARLSQHWDIRRIAAIDRTILRMAIVELEHVPDIPMKVVMNEAIELARQFSTSNSSAFVNGILDAYMKGTEKVEGE